MLGRLSHGMTSLTSHDYCFLLHPSGSVVQITRVCTAGHQLDQFRIVEKDVDESRVLFSCSTKLEETSDIAFVQSQKSPKDAEIWLRKETKFRERCKGIEYFSSPLDARCIVRGSEH